MIHNFELQIKEATAHDGSKVYHLVLRDRYSEPEQVITFNCSSLQKAGDMQDAMFHVIGDYTCNLVWHLKDIIKEK